MCKMIDMSWRIGVVCACHGVGIRCTPVTVQLSPGTLRGSALGCTYYLVWIGESELGRRSWVVESGKGSGLWKMSYPGA